MTLNLLRGERITFQKFDTFGKSYRSENLLSEWCPFAKKFLFQTLQHA